MGGRGAVAVAVGGGGVVIVGEWEAWRRWEEGEVRRRLEEEERGRRGEREQPRRGEGSCC